MFSDLVDSAELELTKLQEQIKLCEDKAELEGVLVKRDEQINMVSLSLLCFNKLKVTIRDP